MESTHVATLSTLPIDQYSRILISFINGTCKYNNL